MLNLVEMDSYKDLPADGVIEQTVENDCDPETTDYIPPTADAWFVGDRTTVCLKNDSAVPIGSHG